MANITKTELEARIADAISDDEHWPYLGVHCPLALAALDELIRMGQTKHGPMDWQDLDIDGNLNRAEIHVRRYILGHISDDDTDELLNATCRMIMALELREMAKDKKGA